MIIKAVKFKRTENSNWENGICFELNGNTNEARNAEKVHTEDGIIEYVYDIKDDYYKLCIDYKLD